MHFADIARQAATDRRVSSEELLSLRRAGWANGTITPEEAETIFALNDALDDRSAEWVDFFVEAIGEYVLNTMQPAGYVTEEQGKWLIDRLNASGKVESMAEMELVVRLVERASNVPERLKVYVIATLEHEVLSGTGPTRHGGDLSDTHVSEAECRILRRALFAPGSDRPGAISRREAEMLYRIKDACLESENAPEWKRLFVQAVGNHLQGYASASAQISRERAAELEAFMADASSNVGRFLGRMAKTSPNRFGKVFGKKGTDAPTREQLVAADHAVTASEKKWLDIQMSGNGMVDEYDQALLRFLEGGEAP
ncbi:hypothetical protein [Croceicoccus naphthovorans]|nr:hypothetical protein [Croceicoccus naphthovorans]